MKGSEYVLCKCAANMSLLGHYCEPIHLIQNIKACFVSALTDIDTAEGVDMLSCVAINSIECNIDTFIDNEEFGFGSVTKQQAEQAIASLDNFYSFLVDIRNEKEKFRGEFEMTSSNADALKYLTEVFGSKPFEELSFDYTKRRILESVNC